MNIHTLSREQYLPIGIQDAWDFFSSAENLAKITPPEMQFKILSKLGDKPVYPGMKINYIVKPLFNIPLHWTTEISNVDAPHSFTDRQLKGPYALWEHTHTFVPVPGGVKMMDEVKYGLPLGILGSIAHVVVVKQKLEHIFDFRNEKLKQIFGKYNNI